MPGSVGGPGKRAIHSEGRRPSPTQLVRVDEDHGSRGPRPLRKSRLNLVSSDAPATLHDKEPVNISGLAALRGHGGSHNPIESTVAAVRFRH